MITLNGSAPDLLGLSTDTKPDDALPNSLFLELDTGNFYYFDGETETWAKVGESTDSADSQSAGKTLTITKPVLGKTAEKTAEDPEEEATEEEQPEEGEEAEPEEEGEADGETI